MHDYDVIIIGAGIGGLTCGALLAKHGMNVLICEQHDKPGGYCTSYKRGGFTFDIPDVMGGLREGTHFREILSYVGVDRRIGFVEEKRLFRHIFPDVVLDCPTDIDQYQDNLSRAFPNEMRGIAAYLAEQRATWDEIIGSYYHATPLQLLSYPFRFPRLVRYRNWNHRQFAERFIKDMRLRELLGAGWRFLGVDGDRVSALMMVSLMMSYATGGAWYPVGGYQKLADAFADTFRSLGGELRCQACVSRIVMRGSRAVGVELADSSVLQSKAVISNADSRATFLKLIGEERVPGALRRRATMLRPSATGIMLHVATRMRVPGEMDCASVTYNPFYGASNAAFDGCEAGRLPSDPETLSYAITTASSSRYPDLAAKGISIVGIAVMPVPGAGDAVWFRRDRERYRMQKEGLTDVILRAAARLLPGLKSSVLELDLNTPLTYERYTGAAEGCWYDAAATPGQSLFNRLPAATPIPGLFITGAKTCPGHGMYGAIFGGLFAADAVTRGRFTRGRVPLAHRG